MGQKRLREPRKLRTVTSQVGVCRYNIHGSGAVRDTGNCKGLEPSSSHFLLRWKIQTPNSSFFSVLWWELLVSFLLPQGFDADRGTGGLFDLFIQKMFSSSSVITELHNDMRPFSGCSPQRLHYMTELSVCVARIFL